MFKALLLTVLVVLVCKNEAARILAYYAMPLYSHQIPFRPLTMELVKRGHELVVVTSHPIYPKGDGPANLREIDINDCYAEFSDLADIRVSFNRDNLHRIFKKELDVLECETNKIEIKRLMNDKSQKFDLIIVDDLVKMPLGFGYHFKAPIIQISTLGGIMASFLCFGAPTHIFIYPTPPNERLHNLTIPEKFNEIITMYKMYQVYRDVTGLLEDGLRRIFGPGVPTINQMCTNVDMLLLNSHPVWDFNRPVPPNIVYLGNLITLQKKELPADLKTYLDSSKNGVIYVCFGTTVLAEQLEFTQILINTLSKLPYDILWKWDNDELPGRTPNIKIKKWLPQADLLRHPKVKLFITQGGINSMHEAIAAGVPVISIPIFADQAFNAEQILYFRIGHKLERKTLTEEKLNNSIYSIIGDESYRTNIVRLNSIMNDRPMGGVELAVYWAEYVIRHKGAKHLRSKGADVTWAEFLELDLVSYVLVGSLIALTAVIYLIYFVYITCCSRDEKIKTL